MRADFRRTLKSETQEDHARVDARMSSIDLGSVDGFVRFLSIHQRCFRFIRDRVTADSKAGSGLDEILRRIDADLTALGASASQPVVSDVRQPDPLAVDYVLEGSRLGSKVLKRRWLAAGDPEVRRASAYFSLVPEPGRWHEVCDQLSGVPAGGARAQAIIDDTRMLFALFFAAAGEPMADQLEGAELAT